jgi:hypothetical protein
MPLSDRQHDAFADPAKAACREAISVREHDQALVTVSHPARRSPFGPLPQ